jgi:hypothetical protein
MARPVAVLGLIMAALVAAAPARADERDRATIDRVDVRPSPIHGLARIRALVSATTLQGARIPEAGKPQVTVKVGGERRPALLGFAALGEVELNLVIVVATTDVFRDHLDRVREAIDVGLLTPLEKLGPSRVRVAILGYGERTLGQKSVGTIAAARAALARLTVDEVTPEVALVAAIAEATTLATKTKPKAAGAMQRTAIVIVSDGDGIPAEPEARAKVTKVAEAAGKKNVRIHALGFSPSQARRPLLNLGELSKQSGGTFRWVQTVEGFAVATEQLVDQLARQYVVTALVAPSELEDQKLAVTIDNGGVPLTTAALRLPPPTCAKEVCDPNAYCVRGECVPHARQPKAGALRWLLLGLGGGLGLVALGFGGRAVARQRRSPRPAAIAPAVGPGLSGAPAAPMAPAPAPAAPPGGPVLIVMSGPEAGRQIPLHHGFALGKAPDNHLSLAHDGTASGHHAQITFDGAAWVLTDLGSTNGSFANGNRITTVRLFPGMTLRLGSTDLRFWQA